MNNVVIALVVILLPGTTRVIRSQTLSLKELDYVHGGALPSDASPARIVLRHILPNVAATYIVLSTITLGFAIVVEGILKLPRRGHSAGRPLTWGGMLTLGGFQVHQYGPLAGDFPRPRHLTLVVFAINLLGDALRDGTRPQGCAAGI